MIHGLIIVNKPNSITSHDVVDHVRKTFKIKKVGHFGTLDPLAEGLLLVAVGKATKFFDFYIKKKKIYSGKINFGYATDTYDREGVATSEKKEIDLRKIDIKALLSPFQGKIEQIPPIFSAKKLKGKPLYRYAREQQEVEIKPVTVEIYSLQAKVIDNSTLWFEAATSSGTYIRSLAHDIGQKAGCGAYLGELKRLQIGEFHLDQAVTLEELDQEVKAGNISKVVLPIETLLPEFPKIIITQGGRKAVSNGMALGVKDVIKILSTKKSEYYRLFDEAGKLLALSRKDDKSMKFVPFIVFPD